MSLWHMRPWWGSQARLVKQLVPTSLLALLAIMPCWAQSDNEKARFVVGQPSDWANSAKVTYPEPGESAGYDQVCIPQQGDYVGLSLNNRTVRWVGSGGSPVAKTFASHGSPVSALAAVSSGKYLASADDAGVIHITMTSSGIRLRPIRQHTKAVTALAFSSKNSLASVSEDGTVWVGSYLNGRGKKLVAGEPKAGPLRCVTFSPDGTLLAAGDDAGFVCVWDHANNKVTAQFQPVKLSDQLKGKPAQITAVQFGPENKTLMLGDATGRLIWWDLENDKLKEFAKPHQSKVVGLHWITTKPGAVVSIEEKGKAWFSKPSAGLEKGLPFWVSAGGVTSTSCRDYFLLTASPKDTTAYLWNLYPLRAWEPIEPKMIMSATLEEAYADLQKNEPALAWQAMDTFRKNPKKTLDFLTKKMVKAQPVSLEDKANQLLKDLDSDDLTVRDKAKKGVRALMANSDSMVKYFEAAMKSTSSLEVKYALKAIFEDFDPTEVIPDPERQRKSYLRELLVGCDDPRAKKLLAKLP